MSQHLPLLQAMFPGKIFLNSADMAKVLGISRGHLFNMSTEGTLPFKMAKNSVRLQVSIVEMARFLDTKVYKPEVVVPKADITTVVKKLGRPRGRTSRSSR